MTMKRTKLKAILVIPMVLFCAFYLIGVVMVMQDDRVVAPLDKGTVSSKQVAIFGASGTAGDGILKAALLSKDIEKIHVFTRRLTPRIQQGTQSGKVQATIHKDYLNYQAISAQLIELDAVYWAIGTNSLGVDEKTYRMIHADFPIAFVKAWNKVSQKAAISFHYISSSDISDDSTAMWAKEKRRAEKLLFALAEKTKLRVIAYRPDYIGATEQQAHIGQKLLYWFFSPVGAAVKAEQIGQAMIEVSARDQSFKNASLLYTGKIIRYSDAYAARK